jgi:hypothetical protein
VKYQARDNLPKARITIHSASPALIRISEQVLR